jgi:hypothetical protein
MFNLRFVAWKKAKFSRIQPCAFSQPRDTPNIDSVPKRTLNRFFQKEVIGVGEAADGCV